MGTIQMLVSPSELLGERVSVASCLSLLGLVSCYITTTCAPVRGSVKLGCLQFRLAGLIKCFGMTDSSSALLCSQDSFQWLVKLAFLGRGSMVATAKVSNSQKAEKLSRTEGSTYRSPLVIPIRISFLVHVGRCEPKIR